MVFSRFKGFRRRPPPQPAVIVGTGYREYALYERLQAEGGYDVLFFVNEEPWSHRTRLGKAELRYPVELRALCEKHGIKAVFYCDAELLGSLPKLNLPLIQEA